jgi:hypothetical protein
LRTPRWRETDSNFWYRGKKGRGFPQRSPKAGLAPACPPKLMDAIDRSFCGFQDRVRSASSFQCVTNIGFSLSRHAQTQIVPFTGQVPGWSNSPAFRPECPVVPKGILVEPSGHWPGVHLSEGSPSTSWAVFSFGCGARFCRSGFAWRPEAPNSKAHSNTRLPPTQTL